MNGPSYFEIQTDDIQRVMRFYEGVFGWKFIKDPRQNNIEYWRIETGGMPGGLLKRPAPAPLRGLGANAFTSSMLVDDFDAMAKKILALGGSVAFPKFAIPGLCWQGYFLDTESNVFGLYQPDTDAK